jgi:hypothetical protein
VYERRGTPPAPGVAAPAAPAAAPRLDPDRFRLLKRPLEGGPAGAGNTPPASPRWPRS